MRISRNRFGAMAAKRVGELEGVRIKCVLVNDMTDMHEFSLPSLRKHSQHSIQLNILGIF